MASCLSRHDQMVYSIFQNRAPRGVKFFFSNDSKVKESIYQDGLTTNNDHQSFRNPRYSKFENIFIFHLLFKIKHHPILRKKQNEKLFFGIFFQKFKTLFFLQESNFSS